MTNVRSKLATGAVWVIGARLLSNFAAFIGMLALARLLLPEDFGIVAIALTVTAIISSLTEISVSAALVHLRTVEEDHFHSAWTLGMARSLVLSAILGGLAWPISWAYGDIRLMPLMLAMAGITLISGFSNPRLAIFARQLSFWQDAMLNLGGRVSGLVISILIALMFRSYWAIVAGQATTMAFTIVIGYLFMPYRPRIRFYDLRRMFAFSAWLSLQQAVNTLNWRSDPLLISFFAGPTALGHYTVGDNLASLPTREALSPLSGMLFPGLARVAGDLVALREGYLRAQSILSMIAFPMGFGLALVAEPVMMLALGETWAPAVPVVQILAGIFAVQTLSSALQPLAMATGQTRMLFLRDCVNFIIRVPLMVAGVMMGGLIGAVIARCFSGLISTAIGIGLVNRLLSISPLEQLRANARTILATIVMISGTGLWIIAASDALGNGWKALITVAMGAALYIVTLLASWQIMGRPRGPELDFLQIAARAFPPLRYLFASS